MRLVVTDANILIDLAAGGLLHDMFGLPDWAFCVPDTLYVEELAQHHGALPAMGLKVVAQPPDAVAHVMQLRQRYRRTSINDLFALTLAHRLGCALLSGDGPLRAAAKDEGVEVHGTLWLMEALVVSGQVSVGRMVAGYKAMRSDGSRLPWHEVQAQIDRHLAARAQT
ncbi:hypothetical protein KQ945_16890 [Bacillus subtilis subsp. subtilis]|nr:hypothetical protein [Bacillus subtilis subsp. subtilis]